MILLSFGLWWEGLSTFTKIYWMITIPASAIFVIQFALSYVSSRTETIKLNPTASKTIDSDATITFQIFSFKNFMGFFTGFGWSGLACIDSGLSIIPTILTSLLCGLIIMATMAIIIYFMSKLLKTVEEDL